MKVKITKTTTEEQYVTFPFYKKSLGGAYIVKAVSEYCAVWIEKSLVSPGIQVKDYLSELLFSTDYLTCTEKEFDEAYISIKGAIESKCYTTKFEDVGELDTEVKQDKPEWEVNNER